MSPGPAQSVEIAGRKVRLTNLDKVLYPSTGTTKRDVIDYYTSVATTLLPLLQGRLVTRKRWPDGVAADSFFEKNLPRGTPEWVQRVSVEHTERTIDYPLVTDPATLAWLAQSGALELHVPQWRADRPEFASGARIPDRLVIDLDPGPGTGLAECAEVARHARDRLHELGLTPVVPVTSGSKGIQLYARLAGDRPSAEINALAKELAQQWAAERPELIVSKMRKDLRHGKVLVDWSQNHAAKTTITPYSLRGRERPTVAAPRTWEELADPELAQLDHRTVRERLAEGIDPALGLLSAAGTG